MRKTLSIMAFLALPLVVAAGPIDKERAQQIANEFITDVSARNASVMHKAPVSHQLTYKDTGYNNLYTFSDDKNGGFVVVAGDDRIAQPVLAYSETDHVNMYALPEVTQIMLQSYEEQLASLPPNYAPTANSETSQHEVIYPLLTSMWHQYLPFRYNTPGGMRGTGPLAADVLLEIPIGHHTDDSRLYHLFRIRHARPPANHLRLLEDA